MWNKHSKGEMDLCSLQTKRPFITLAFLLVPLYSCSSFPSTESYDASDPNGNITIKWDIKRWTPDGYAAIVTIYNYQKYRRIQAPGWKLGWTWEGREVIWGMMGAQTTEQGDCSSYKSWNIPQSCMMNPNVVDFFPGTPYNQQTANCCKGGVLGSWSENPDKAVSSFWLRVGEAGTINNTVMLPSNFTLDAPGKGYTCGPAKAVPTRFITLDGRSVTVAMMTRNITCTYSPFLQPKTPACCVSLSSYISKSITNCPTCSCGCQEKNHPMNSLNYKPLTYHGSLNGSTMLWGIKSFSDVILEAGPYENVQ